MPSQVAVAVRLLRRPRRRRSPRRSCGPPGPVRRCAVGRRRVEVQDAVVTRVGRVVAGHVGEAGRAESAAEAFAATADGDRVLTDAVVVGVGGDPAVGDGVRRLRHAGARVAERRLRVAGVAHAVAVGVTLCAERRALRGVGQPSRWPTSGSCRRSSRRRRSRCPGRASTGSRWRLTPPSNPATPDVPATCATAGDAVEKRRRAGAYADSCPGCQSTGSQGSCEPVVVTGASASTLVHIRCRSSHASGSPRRRSPRSSKDHEEVDVIARRYRAPEADHRVVQPPDDRGRFHVGAGRRVVPGDAERAVLLTNGVQVSVVCAAVAGL